MASLSPSRDREQTLRVIETAHRRICTEIPAPGTAEILARMAALEPHSMQEQVPIVWREAFDYQVDDLAGNRFIDFTSGIFVANVGHTNLAVWNAIENARGDGTPLHSYTFATKARLDYLEALTKWSGFEKAHLVCSGTEATESALRIMRARAHAQHRPPGILYVEGAFHGRTRGARMVSGLDYPVRFPVGDSLRSVVPAEWLCGVMLETFQGWSASFYPEGWVKNIAEFCREHDLLLCFDEMQAGFARTGKKFGYEHYGVIPDLVCFGKAAGGGLPLSGVLGRAELLDLDAELSSTHGGNPLACVAGLAVLKEIDRMHLVQESERKGRIIEGTALRMNGHGMIRALPMPSAPLAKRVVELCYRNGLLLINTGRPSIKIGPPLTTPDSALCEGLEVLRDAIAECVT